MDRAIPIVRFAPLDPDPPAPPGADALARIRRPDPSPSGRNELLRRRNGPLPGAALRRMNLISAEPMSPIQGWKALTAGLECKTSLLAALSPAEQMVAVYVAQGFSNREIAATLGKSESTVSTRSAPACASSASGLAAG